MVYMHHLKSKRRQVQGYLRWLEPTVWHSSQRRLSSPLYNDWRSLQKALETQREFQQVAARRRSFHQHRGHQKTGRGQSGGSFSRTRYSGVRKQRNLCFFPRCTTTARTHSWYCQEEKTSSFAPSSTSNITTTSRIGACQCPVSHSPAVRDDRSPWWYQNQLRRSREPHPEQCRRRLHCPGALPRRVRLRGSPKCSEVPAVRWCRRTPSCKLQADLPSIRGTHTSRH